MQEFETYFEQFTIILSEKQATAINSMNRDMNQQSGHLFPVIFRTDYKYGDFYSNSTEFLGMIFDYMIDYREQE